jgi:hypothetical protein
MMHGDVLVCARYRYDEASSTRIKTVGLIVEQIPWRPKARKFTDNDLDRFAEKELMDSARAAKGRWHPDVKLWFIRYGTFRGSELEKHMILYAFPNKQPAFLPPPVVTII